MKIYATGTVHNEQDIIESLCRHIMQFCDGMVVCDNHSTDNTRDIILKLVGEGLNIHLIEGFKNSHTRAQIAFDQFNADLVLPTDADEFLFRDGGGNPRAILETLNPEVEYSIPWRSYVFTQESERGTQFLPERFPFRLLNEVKQYDKVVISRKIWKTFACTLFPGNHFLVFENSKDRDAVPAMSMSSLYYAHYPIRSRLQAIQKCVEHEFLLSSRADRFQGEGYQYKRWLDRIIQTGALTVDETSQFSIRYNIPDSMSDAQMQIVEDPPDTSFAGEAILLKYSNYSINEKDVFKRVVAEAYRLICAQAEALRKEKLINIALQELAVLEGFFMKAPEEKIKQEASYISERVKFNLERLDKTDAQLASRFEAIFFRIKKYLE